MNDRTFRFSTGHTISVRQDYDPRLYYMTLEAYKEDNPPPEPPIIERPRKVKGGTKIDLIKDYQDEVYLRAYNIWDAQLVMANIDMLYDMAIDPDSIDMDVVEAGRAWAEQNGYGVPRDDVRAYLRFVTTPLTPGGKPEDSELAKFHQWLSEVGGPSGALVQRFTDTFRAGVQKAKNLPGIPAANGQTQLVEAVALANVH